MKKINAKSLIFLIIISLAIPVFASKDNRNSVGAGIGYGAHFGKETEIDSVSSASQKVEDKDFFDNTVDISLYSDLSIINFKTSSLGLRTGLDISFPSVYYNLQVMPQYKIFFNNINLWFATGLTFQYIDTIDDQLHISFATSLGIDFKVKENIYLGFTLDMNMVNFKGVEYEETINNEKHKRTRRYDNAILKLNLSYTF